MTDAGSGNFTLDVAVTALLWVAALLQLAVLRDHSVPESRQADASRWLVAAGLVGLAGRFTFVLLDTGDLLVPVVSLVPVVMFAVGSTGLALDKFRAVRYTRRRDDVAPGKCPDMAGNRSRSCL